MFALSADSAKNPKEMRGFGVWLRSNGHDQHATSGTYSLTGRSSQVRPDFNRLTII